MGTAPFHASFGEFKLLFLAHKEFLDEIDHQGGQEHRGKEGCHCTENGGQVRADRRDGAESALNDHEHKVADSAVDEIITFDVEDTCQDGKQQHDQGQPGR